MYLLRSNISEPLACRSVLRSCPVHLPEQNLSPWDSYDPLTWPCSAEWAFYPRSADEEGSHTDNIPHSRETLRAVLRHEKQEPPSHRWFPKGVLCWVGKNPSGLPGCPGEHRKGNPGRQELRSRIKRRDGQAGGGAGKWSRNLTELPGPPLCPVSTPRPKHCREVASGRVSAKESCKDFVNGQLQIHFKEKKIVHALRVYANSKYHKYSSSLLNPNLLNVSRKYSKCKKEKK